MTEEFAPIVWVDELPPATGKQREYAWFAEQLRQNPNKWAMLPGPRKGGYSSQIKTGKFVAFRPAGAFDAVTRRPVDGDTRPATYVRYVGLNPDGPAMDNGATVKRSSTREDSLRQLGVKPT